VTDILVTCNTATVTYTATGQLAAPNEDGSGPYGTIEPTTQQVAEGGYADFLATPNPGYRWQSTGFGSCGDWTTTLEPSGVLRIRVGPLFSNCTFQVAFVLDSAAGFRVGGSVSGLSGTLILQNNGTDEISLGSDGAFSFPTRVADGAGYLVTVKTQPQGQTCSVSNATGTVSGSNVTNVIVECISDVGRYTVGGTVSGLNGSVTLANNSSDEIVVNSDGAFSFPALLQDGDSYLVTVTAQPSGQLCSVANASGVVNANNVSNILVTCEATNPSYTVTAVIINGAGSATPSSQLVQPGEVAVVMVVPATPNTIPLVVGCDGSLMGNTYTTAPVTQSCQIEIDFDPPGQVNLRAFPGSRAVELDWDDIGAIQYNLIYSAEPGCDVRNYSLCRGGTMLSDVQPPIPVTDLENGRSYWFYIESIFDNTETISEEVGSSPNIFVVNGKVQDIGVQTVGSPELVGSIAIAGDFNGIGTLTGSAIIVHQTEERVSGAFPTVDGVVYAAIPDGSGGWYVGGEFQEVGGLRRHNLAHIRSDGSLGQWQPRANGAVRALALLDGVVYVAGNFTSLNDVPRFSTAAIDETGTLLSWAPQFNGEVMALAIEGQRIFVGGGFSSVNGIPRTGITDLDSTGKVGDFQVNVLPQDVPASVNRITTNEGWIYYVYVDAEGADKMGAQQIVDGAGHILTLSGGTVNAIALDGENVYIGGDFNGFTASWGGRGTDGGLARLGRALEPPASGFFDPSVEGTVFTLAILGEYLYVGGDFSRIGRNSGLTHNNLAKISTVTAAADGWSPMPLGTVNVIDVDPKGLLVAGDFGSVFTPSSCVAKVKPSGILDRDFAPALLSSECRVNALAFGGDHLYVGGEFGLRLLDSKGLLLDRETFKGSGTIYDVAVGTNIVVVAGTGEFYCGTTRVTNLYALRAPLGSRSLDECAWSPFPDSTVHSVDVHDGVVYFGGTFTQLYQHGVTRIRLAAVGEDGMPTSWAPRIGDTVYALDATADGIYVGGQSSSLQRALSKYGLDGTLDSSWTPDVSHATVRASVRAIQASDSFVYVAGIFDTVDGIPRSGIAAINGGGALDSWQVEPDGRVSVISVDGGRVRIAGAFSNILERQD
jgi:hypothetical protein